MYPIDLRVGLLLFCILSQNIHAADKAQPNLVDKLATTNLPMKISGEPGEQRAKRGEKFDPKEYERVNKVVADVTANVEEHWPDLFSHLDDTRYCITVGIDAGYPRNWTVGEFCQDLLGTTLSKPYYHHLPGTKQNFHRFNVPSFAKDKHKLREWCLERKDKKLYQLQIEACAGAIAELESLQMDQDEKKKYIAAFQKEIESLEKSQTAIVSKRAE